MKLSTKGRYAVMAMADIALGIHRQAGAAGRCGRPPGHQPGVSRAAVCQAQASPAGRERPRAGRRLHAVAGEPDDIRIAEIVQAVDKPLQVTPFQGDAIEGCVNGEKCVTHELWAALGRQILGFLSAVTLGDVINRRNLALEASVRRAMAQPVRTMA